MPIGIGKAGRQARRAARKEKRDLRRNKGADGGGEYNTESSDLLKYPLDILSEDLTELMRFAIKGRDDITEDKQTIYLYTPPGIALADSASYTSQEFGVIGGIQSTVSDMVTEGKLTGIFSGMNVDLALDAILG